MQKKPRIPKQDRSIATKQQLFRSALELFAEQGYHHTNTKRIAARAGIGVGSFYAYYQNKKALFLEVIQYYYQRIQQTAIPGDLVPSAVEEPLEFLGTLLRQLYDAHDISPQLHREITGMRYSDPEVDRLISAEETKTIAAIRQLIEQLGPALTVDDPEAAAHIVHRSAEEVIHSIKIFGAAIEPDRLLAELKRMLGRYLCGPKTDL